MMKRIKKYGVALCLALGISQAYAQQNIQFTQYAFNGLSLNPAYAGYREELTASLSYRTQWVGLSGAPNTGTLSLDGLTNYQTKKVGLGLTLTNDRLGAESVTSVYGNYAYRLQLDPEDTRRLSFGLAVGLTQYAIDESKFVYNDLNDPSTGADYSSKISPDMRAGIYYTTPKFYLGASVVDLFSSSWKNIYSSGQDSKLSKRVRHIYITSGTMIRLSENFDLKPTIMLKEDLKGPTNMDLNSYLLINKKIWFGANYRTSVKLWEKKNLQADLDRSDVISGIFQIYMSNRFRLGYSYDFTMNKLSSSQSGSHEISLSLAFPSRNERVLSPRYF